MPIDPEKALGAQLPPMTYDLSPREVILYALGVGCSPSGDELRFVYEKGLKVLPTFGVIPPLPALHGLVAVPGIDINPVMLVHRDHCLEVPRHPLPTGGRLISRPKISHIYDQGKGAIVELEVHTETEDGETVFFNRFSLFVRGELGQRGARVPLEPFNLPDRPPDRVIVCPTRSNQAVLYRLSGDKNPLHVDPQFAAMAGFKKPILHGLCTFAVAGRAVLGEYCDHEPERFKSMKVRFSRPVWPGDTIVTEMWQETPEKILLRATTREKPRAFVLTHGTVELSN